MTVALQSHGRAMAEAVALANEMAGRICFSLARSSLIASAWSTSAKHKSRRSEDR